MAAEVWITGTFGDEAIGKTMNPIAVSQLANNTRMRHVIDTGGTLELTIDFREAVIPPPVALPVAVPSAPEARSPVHAQAVVLTHVTGGGPRSGASGGAGPDSIEL